MASLVEAADSAKALVNNNSNNSNNKEDIKPAPTGEGSIAILDSTTPNGIKTAQEYAEEHLNHSEPAPVGENIGREIYYDPGATNSFVVRGKTYMVDGKKTPAGPAMGTLLHAVSGSGSSCMSSVGFVPHHSHYFLWFQ